jgi:TolB-like protein
VHTLDAIVTPSGEWRRRRRSGNNRCAGASVASLHLGWVVATAVMLLLASGAAFAWRARSVNFATGPTRVAVLPFENLGDSSDAYFADGVSDAVRGKLSALPTLKVIGRSSSTLYRHANKSSKQIADELGVQYLLTGTVRWEKHPGGQSRVLVSPELLQAAPASSYAVRRRPVRRLQVADAGRSHSR